MTCYTGFYIKFGFMMGSPKSKSALQRLGRDIRYARLRRGMAVADLAIRSGTSASTLGRLEKGEPGVGLGTLCDVLVALGLIERLAGLADLQTDELGLALSNQQLPKRARSARVRMAGRKPLDPDLSKSPRDEIDPDGAAF